MRLTEEAKKKIIAMRRNGATQKWIADKTGYSQATVRTVLVANGVDERLEHERAVDWIKEHWGPWKMPKKKKVREVEYRNGYRVVHVGDKGIRTPYRPDGIWR